MFSFRPAPRTDRPIRLGNLAMMHPADVADVLRKVANDVEAGEFPRKPVGIFDRNGNRVGWYRLATPVVE
jgi:uncharacterized protein with von Willebrand factor type A (vWA) domain